MSTTAFIRYLRIREATRLLSTHPERSVSEVAYEVGFNSHSYFTRCFRELTGALPNDVRAKPPRTEHTFESLEQTLQHTKTCSDTFGRHLTTTNIGHGL